MKKLILLVCAVLLSWVNAFAQKDWPFKDGEQFTFSIMYKWGAVNTEVGLAEFTVAEERLKGEDVYHMACKAKTAPFFDIFYKIREDLESWDRVEDLRPLQFTRNTLEGSYTATNTYDFDWNSGVIKADINFAGRGQQYMEIPVKPGEGDIVWLIYQMRAMDEKSFAKGAKTKFHFAIDDDVFDVTVTCRGEETIKVRKMGKMKAWHISCSVVQGALFEGDEQLHLWFSADENRIPVAAHIPLKVGNVQAWVSGWHGLKYDFNAWADGRKR